MLEFSLKFVLHQGGTKLVMNSMLKVVMQTVQFTRRTIIQNTSKKSKSSIGGLIRQGIIGGEIRYVFDWCIGLCLDRCDRMIQNESRDPNGGNVCLFSAATCTSQCKFRSLLANPL